MRSGSVKGKRGPPIACLCFLRSLPTLINLHFFSPPPRTALAEQDLAKVRAAVDALAEDAWMYEAPRHSSNE